MMVPKFPVSCRFFFGGKITPEAMDSGNTTVLLLLGPGLFSGAFMLFLLVSRESGNLPRVHV